MPRSTLVRVRIAHVRSSIYVAQPTSDSQFSAVLPLSHRYRLEGRGTYKRFSSLAKVIPVFKTILSSYEERVEPYSGVNYDKPSALEDHIAINLRAA